jgi:FkbM family methyltransferase
MYSQNNEEEFILNYFRDKEKGLYVDLGCGHSECISNTLRLYELGWRGLCVDSMTKYGESFKEQRPEDIFLNVAVLDYDGVVTAYDTVVEGSWLADEYEIKKYKNFKIPCMTMESILEKYPKFYECDFLNMDIELCEKKVLSKIDFNKFKPQLMCIEVSVRGIDDSEEIEKYINKFYKKIYTISGNSFYERIKQ